MSSFPHFSTAAEGRLFPAAAPKSPGLIFERLSAMPKLTGVTAASRLEVRPTPEMASSGIPEIDGLTGGLPRGCLSEICGSTSSGRTSVLLAALAAATQRQEACALVDVSDAFHPQSAAAVAVNFEKLLWIRCGGSRHQRQGHSFSRADTSARTRGLGSGDNQQPSSEGPVEQALQVTDLILQSGGFGLVAIDFGDIPFKTARRISQTSWFRFQRTVEPTSTVLFILTPAPCAQTCATLLLKVKASGKKLSAVSFQPSAKDSPTHTQLFDGLHVEGELLRSRLQRKPVRSATTAFTTKARAG